MGCYFWYQWNIEPYRQQAAETERIVQQQKAQEITPVGTAKQTEAESPTIDIVEEQSVSSEKTIENTEKTIENTDTNVKKSDTRETKPNQNVAKLKNADQSSVSPYGFGNYPKVPKGFPKNIRIPWQWSEDTFNHVSADMRPNLELAARVLIKLWNQGETSITGAQVTEEHKVYPYYPNTAYVTYKEYELVDGTITNVITSYIGGPDLPDITEEMMISGNIPGVHLIDKEEGAIDALQFLNFE